MVCLIIKALLADDQVCSHTLELFYHLRKLVLLELLDTGDVELVLGLWLRRLERTCENGKLSVSNFGGRLRIREVLVYNRESPREPPISPSTLIKSKSTSLRSRSATERIASTAIFPKWSCTLDTIILPRLASQSLGLLRLAGYLKALVTSYL